MGSGFRTFTTSEVLTASNVQNYLMEQSVMSFASTGARDAQILSPEAGMSCYINSNDIYEGFYHHDGTQWFCSTTKSATVTTAESTSSTSYVDLATSGPSVTVYTGTKAIVTVSARMKSTSAPGVYPYDSYMSFAVSGATTIAVSDNYAQTIFFGGTNYVFSAARSVYLTTLTAGANTFTAKYKTGGNTCEYTWRTITVQAVP